MNWGAAIRQARRTPLVVTAGVAVGLFAAAHLGNFIPDNLAATVCMFSAGLLTGLAIKKGH